MTNAVSERSVSTRRKIKNWFRTSMTQVRPNHYILLAIYKELRNKLNLIDVATNEFCFGSTERSRLFGEFCQNVLGVKVCNF